MHLATGTTWQRLTLQVILTLGNGCITSVFCLKTSTYHFLRPNASSEPSVSPGRIGRITDELEELDS